MAEEKPIVCDPLDCSSGVSVLGFPLGEVQPDFIVPFSLSATTTAWVDFETSLTAFCPNPTDCSPNIDYTM